MQAGDGEPTGPGRTRTGLVRLWPLALVAIAAGLAAWAFGDALSFETLKRHHAGLTAWRDANWGLAAAGYLAVYVLAVSLSLPGAVWLTLAGGFLFGLVPGTILTVIAATLGACGVFMIARSSLGALLADRAGPQVARIRAGLEQGLVSYLLILRLVPVVPFFVANLAPALVGVPLGVFAWTTLLGIIPGTAVFASIGSGLGQLIAEGREPDLGVIFSPTVLGPLIGLAALAALPLLIRRLRPGRV